MPETAFSEARWIDRSDRLRLEVGGPDRVKFLHNLVTNDVKRLAEGSGLEAFVTSLQGKTLAYLTLLAGLDSILFRTDPGVSEALLPHLRKYGIFDDVAIEDVSGRTFEYHLLGPGLDAILGHAGLGSPPEGALRHRSSGRDGSAIRVVRESPTGRPGLTLIGPSDAAPGVRAVLDAAGVVALDPAAFDALRIEAGTPVSGRDVTPANLPQEVGRDDRTINFVKGCYLGQETVARLDALGHVNRILKGAKVEGPTAPSPGAPLSFEGKAVGAVTSSAFSTGWDAPVVLAYLKVAQAVAGTRLTVEVGGDSVVAVVADLPMLPGEGA